MIWLFLSIASSTLIFAVFKLFDRFSINNLQAIVVNYFVAFTVGYFFGDFDLHPSAAMEKPWIWNVIFLGFLFITLFQVMALVSQRFGVSAVSVSVKMSLVIPVIAAVYLYNDNLSVVKITGIICALVAVYMATLKPSAQKDGKNSMFLPIILFLGSGFLDAFINFNQQTLISPDEHDHFASSAFLSAGIFGALLISYRVIKADINLRWKNLIGGIALGIPNYGSIYFLLKALDQYSTESSVIFPVNNVGIVALSVIIGKLVFKEQLSSTNRAGIVLALIAIILIAIT